MGGQSIGDRYGFNSMFFCTVFGWWIVPAAEKGCILNCITAVFALSMLGSAPLTRQCGYNYQSFKERMCFLITLNCLLHILFSLHLKS